jgi:hypothetical protein
MSGKDIRPNRTYFVRMDSVNFWTVGLNIYKRELIIQSHICFIHFSYDSSFYKIVDFNLHAESRSPHMK